MVSGRLYASHEPGAQALGGNGREKEVPASPGAQRCYVLHPSRGVWAAVSNVLSLARGINTRD